MIAERRLISPPVPNLVLDVDQGDHLIEVRRTAEGTGVFYMQSGEVQARNIPDFKECKSGMLVRNISQEGETWGLIGGSYDRLTGYPSTRFSLTGNLKGYTEGALSRIVGQWQTLICDFWIPQPDSHQSRTRWGLALGEVYPLGRMVKIVNEALITPCPEKEVGYILAGNTTEAVSELLDNNGLTKSRHDYQGIQPDFPFPNTQGVVGRVRFYEQKFVPEASKVPVTVIGPEEMIRRHR